MTISNFSTGDKSEQPPHWQSRQENASSLAGTDIRKMSIASSAAF